MTEILVSAELLSLGGSTPLPRGTVTATALDGQGRQPVTVERGQALFPTVVKTELMSGELAKPLELHPSTGTWAWQIELSSPLSPSRWRRFVRVPDRDYPINLGDLETVDPTTLEPLVDPDPTWMEIRDMWEDVQEAALPLLASLVTLHPDAAEPGVGVLTFPAYLLDPADDLVLHMPIQETP